jgi:hypothetical protein
VAGLHEGGAVGSMLITAIERHAACDRGRAHPLSYRELGDPNVERLAPETPGPSELRPRVPKILDDDAGRGPKEASGSEGVIA